jgi:hypothetical protein
MWYVELRVGSQQDALVAPVLCTCMYYDAPYIHTLPILKVDTTRPNS